MFVASDTAATDERIGRPVMPSHHPNVEHASDIDQILALARSAGLLITLDGQIGREKYQSIAGSLTAFMRFVEALRANLVDGATA